MSDGVRSRASSIVSDEASEDEGEDTYIVREILDHCKKDGVLHFLVAWKGWDDPNDNTWEPQENLWGALSCIKDYWRRKGCLDKAAAIKIPDKKEKEDEAEEGTDEEEEYKVQKILIHRTVRELIKNGIKTEKEVRKEGLRYEQILYRVRWEGYAPDDDTWETESNLKDVGVFIEYQKKHRLGKYAGERSTSPTVDRERIKKRPGSPISKGVSKKMRDAGQSSKSVYMKASKQELEMLRSLHAHGSKKVEKMVLGDGDMFIQSLSNAESQKKALLKQKALESKKKKEAELRAKDQAEFVDPDELYKQYEDEARRALNEFPPRVQKVTPEAIEEFKKTFREQRKKLMSERKKQRQARRARAKTEAATVKTKQDPISSSTQSNADVRASVSPVEPPIEAKNKEKESYLNDLDSLIFCDLVQPTEQPQPGSLIAVNTESTSSKVTPGNELDNSEIKSVIKQEMPSTAIPTSPTSSEVTVQIKETTPLESKQEISKKPAKSQVTIVEQRRLKRAKFLQKFANLVKGIEGLKVNNNKASKNDVIYENLVVCKNIRLISDKYVRKRCKKVIGDFMSDCQNSTMDKDE